MIGLINLAVSFARHSLVPMDMALISLYALLPTVVGLMVGTRYRHRISEAQFRRLQFTPDLLPADLVGTLIYDQKNGEFIPPREAILVRAIR